MQGSKPCVQPRRPPRCAAAAGAASRPPSQIPAPGSASRWARPRAVAFLGRRPAAPPPPCSAPKIRQLPRAGPEESRLGSLRLPHGFGRDGLRRLCGETQQVPGAGRRRGSARAAAQAALAVPGDARRGERPVAQPPLGRRDVRDVNSRQRCQAAAARAADPAQEVGGPRPEQRRRRWQTAAEDSGSEEGEGEDGGRQSIKKSFMKKVLGPVAGYAEDFELLQFVYDLSLWSRIGGGKNACKHIPLRLVLQGETFLPLYFKTRHAALIDLQRQCGHPQIFKTMAPWEPSFPYGSTAEGEPEQELAGLETLHHAHVFTELGRGLYTGMNKRSSADGGEVWKTHLLGPIDDGPETSQASGWSTRTASARRQLKPTMAAAAFTATA